MTGVPIVTPNPEAYQSVPPQTDQFLGALPPKRDKRNLMLAPYMDVQKSPPESYDVETKNTGAPRYKAPFEPFRGQTMGSCTISSQAEYVRRIERPRTFGRDLYVPDSVVDARYIDLSNRLYGGGDNGAYELDAINDFLNLGFTFQPFGKRRWQYKISGFAEVPVRDQLLMKIAIWKFKGIKICFAVHQNMYYSGQDEVVTWQPNSPIVGYHSMYADGYDPGNMILVHTWNRKRQRFSWEYVLNAATEAYTLIDAANIRVDPQLAKVFNIKKFNKDKKEVMAESSEGNVSYDENKAV